MESFKKEVQSESMDLPVIEFVIPSVLLICLMCCVVLQVKLLLRHFVLFLYLG